MADGKYEELAEPPTAYFIIPYAQFNPGMPTTLIIRASGDPHELIGQVRKTLAELAPNLPYLDVHALSDVLDPQFKPYRIGAVLFTLFGLVALALAAVGLYGVVSYVVTQRSREAGIRLALGAHAADVVTIMLKQGVIPAVAGGVIGLVGAFIVTRFVSSQLFGVSPTDPVTFASVAGLLALVSVLACYVPARRAARVDPVTTLRSE
jgi:ABC-type antimicrobial peptide transport system permease subunit